MARFGDWVPARNYGVQTVVNPTAFPWDFLLMSPRDTSGGVSAEKVGVMEVQTSVLVNRVVGQVYLENTSASRLLIHERIRVGLLDEGGLAAFYANSFEDADAANEPFLFERVYLLAPGETNVDVGVGAHPFFSFIDCKVKRRLNAQEAVFWSMQITGGLGTDEVNVRSYLRTYATL